MNTLNIVNSIRAMYHKIDYL